MEIDSASSSNERIHVVLDQQEVALLSKFIGKGLVSTSLGSEETAATLALHEQFTELESAMDQPDPIAIPKTASKRPKSIIESLYASAEEQRRRDNLVDERTTKRVAPNPQERNQLRAMTLSRRLQQKMRRT